MPSARRLALLALLALAALAPSAAASPIHVPSHVRARHLPTLTGRARHGQGTGADIGAGQTTAFQATATTLDSTLNGKGAWKIVVSSTNFFSDPTALASATSEPPGLGVFTYSFELLDAGVVASAP